MSVPKEGADMGPKIARMLNCIDPLTPDQLVTRVQFARAELADMCGFEHDYDRKRAALVEYERRLALYGWAVPDVTP